MFNRSVKITILLMALVAQLFLFQNCGDGSFEAMTTNKPSGAGDTPIVIKDDDHSLKQYQARVEAQPLYANRQLMYNLLSSIFGPSVKNELVKGVAWASAEMGSGYNTYEKVLLPGAECNKKRDPRYRCDNFNLEQKANPIVGASATREGRRMSACHVGVDKDSSLQFAFKKIEKAATLAKPPQLSDANLQRIFKLFYRGRPLPEAEFFDGLRVVHQQAADETEGWKSVILSLCLSPHWQVM